MTKMPEKQIFRHLSFNGHSIPRASGLTFDGGSDLQPASDGL